MHLDVRLLSELLSGPWLENLIGILEVTRIGFLRLLSLSISLRSSITFHFLLSLLSLRSSLRSSREWLKLHPWPSKGMENKLCISVPKRLASLPLLSHSLGHSSRHLLHHNVKRTSLATTPLIPKSCPKRLSEYASDVLVAKSLLKYFVDVDVVEVEPSGRAFTKLIIASPFAFIA